jgi:hypothetical protein
VRMTRVSKSLLSRTIDATGFRTGMGWCMRLPVVAFSGSLRSNRLLLRTETYTRRLCSVPGHFFLYVLGCGWESRLRYVRVKPSPPAFCLQAAVTESSVVLPPELEGA